MDDLPGPAIAYDQRYIAASGLPATLAEQDRTLRSGKWYFGNLTKGRHTFRVSVDDGKSFIAEKTVFLPFVRADAISDYKSIYVWIGIDVPGADPTPANCPQP